MSVRSEIEVRAFLTRRAREEREKAAACEDNSAALAHRHMAEEYERRLSSGHTGTRAVAPD